MLWFVIFGVIALIITAILVAHNEHGFSVWLLYSFPALWASLAIALLVGGVVSEVALGCGAKTEYILTDVSEIHTLNDNSQLSGRYYLGSSSINEEMRYFYIESTPRGKHMDDVSAEHAHVIPSDKEDPRIEKYSERFSNAALRLFTTPFFDPLVKIYIPEGSITTEFDVELEHSNSDKDINT